MRKNLPDHCLEQRKQIKDIQTAQCTEQCSRKTALIKISMYTAIALLLIFLSAFDPAGDQIARAQTASSPTPIPTYDPLLEPVLPENPSELEMGGFWYWHNCMTCHGDLGQGLTDEFREIWPEDHQNCWDRGCHGGRLDDEGFPIPTVVPALVSADQLAQFSSQQSFFDYLKSTHPPQTPGVLEDQQYWAIVKYLFSMNQRPLEDPTPEPTSTPAPTPSPIIETELAPENSGLPAAVISIGAIVLLVILWRLRGRSSRG